MSAEQTPDIADIAAIVLMHCDTFEDAPLIRCMCGTGQLTLTEHAAHVAAALAPVLAAAVREAEQRALREAADAMDEGADLKFHQSSFAFWLRDRADRITEPVSHEAATSGEEASKA